MSNTQASKNRYSCPSCDRVFDSERGMKVHHAKEHGESLVKEKCICEVCGEEFERYPHQHEGKRCSRQCYYEWLRQKEKKGSYYDCENCGSEVYVEPWEHEWKDSFFCDMDCKAQWQSDNVKGDSHPSWKGGWDNYYGENWHKQREKAWERDDYKCRICGKGEEELGRKPDVHHIVSVRKYKEKYGEKNLAHHLNNLITLCSSHHHQVEQGSIDIPVKELAKNV